VLKFGEGLKQQVADALLRRGVSDGPEERERSALPLTWYCRAGNVTFWRAPLRVSHTLNPINLSPPKRAVREVPFRVRQLPNRVALVVRDDLDGQH